jgi:hypothetical protein
MPILAKGSPLGYLPDPSGDSLKPVEAGSSHSVDLREG